MTRLSFVFLLGLLCVFAQGAQASSLTFVSDTISSSQPSIGANHTIRFTATNLVPVSGKIIITPEAGVFNIPSGLGFADIDLLVGGTNLVLAASPGSGAGSAVGVSITLGTAGKITFTLNDTDAIAAGSVATVRIGTNATFGATGIKQIKNPAGSGSYRIAIETQNSSGGSIDQAQAMVAIQDPTQVTGSQPTPPPAPAPAPSSAPGGAQASAVPSFPTPPKAKVTGTAIMTIDSSKAGSTSISNIDGSLASVSFGVGSVAQSTEIRITSVAKSTAVSTAPVPTGLDIVGSLVYSLNAQAEGVSVTEFLKPATITLNYTDANVYGFDENSLKMYRRAPLTNQWISLASSRVDPAKNTIVAQTQYFSLFAIMGERRAFISRSADFNNDGKVDLVDFSILLYNWGVPKNPLTDINKDGRVDLVDFSIMLYWWTG